MKSIELTRQQYYLQYGLTIRRQKDNGSAPEAVREAVGNLASPRYPESSIMSKRLRGSIVMRQSRVETLVTEEPYVLIGHARICGGARNWPSLPGQSDPVKLGR